MLKISKLYIYPVKSLRGISVQSSLVTDRGLQYDRRWMIVDENNKFLSQRTIPKMALLKIKMNDGGMKVTSLEHAGNDFQIHFDEVDNYLESVTIWNATVEAKRVGKDADDWGTYWPIDPTSLEAQKNYLSQENKYLPQEGETCNCNPPGSDCTNSMKELEKMRWSALNRDYEQCVLNSWIREGCYDEIVKRLGYRFRLIESKVPKSARADSLMSFSFVIENEGFAAPYNERDLELVLRSKSNGSIFRFSLSYDPRTWLPDNGKISVKPSVALPSSMPPGNYEVLLNLPDPEPDLNSNPIYSIRFAKKDTWEPATGYNSLLATVTITN
jgi:hypothetical protein